MEEKSTTNDNLKMLFAIIGSVLMPGVGNLLYNQTKIGLTILVLTILLTGVYFLPLISFFFEDNMITVLIITSIIAILAFLLDVSLIVISVGKLPPVAKRFKKE